MEPTPIGNTGKKSNSSHTAASNVQASGGSEWKRSYVCCRTEFRATVPYLVLAIPWCRNPVQYERWISWAASSTSSGQLWSPCLSCRSSGFDRFEDHLYSSFVLYFPDVDVRLITRPSMMARASPATRRYRHRPQSRSNAPGGDRLLSAN